MSEMLKIESAALRLGGRLLFRDFSLEVRAGEWVCVTGESGCGKSTTANVMCGLQTPTSGHVYFKGTDVTKRSAAQRKIIGRAKEYLLSSDMTMSQIAYELGFQYPQHMSRMFKRVAGCTPNEFRNRQ